MGGECVFIADQERPVGGVRVIEDADHEIAEVSDINERPPVPHVREDRRRAALGPSHQAAEIAADALSVDKGRADDHDLEPRFPTDLPQGGFGLGSRRAPAGRVA